MRSGVRRGGTESSEDETQRLSKTLVDAATISIEAKRIAGATIDRVCVNTSFRFEGVMPMLR